MRPCGNERPGLARAGRAALILAAMPLSIAACHAAGQHDGQPHGQSAATASAQAPGDPGPFVLGVQTHFGQRWPAGRLDSARAIGAPLLRDGLAWEAIEQQPGQFAFPAAMVAPLDRACAAGMQLMLTITPTHPRHDGGLLVTSDEGVAAFGAYLDRLAERFGRCLVAIEVGNEINGSKTLRQVGDLPAAYVALMRAIHGPFRQRHPHVALVGGSTNAIGTGYLVQLFRLGLLDHADGIAVHPYRDHGENLAWELDHLNQAMARHGPILPIWASEIGDTFERPEDAADALITLATSLAGSGVKMASWYALADQKWFPSMGLITQSGAEKPAAAAYRLMQQDLLPHGRPVLVSADPLIRIWRFGQQRWVIWGAPRTATAAPGSRLVDATGKAVDGQAMIGTRPLIAIGGQPALGQTDVLADSLLQFGAAPWSYWAVRTAPGGKGPVRLEPLDSTFATDLGRRDLRPLRLGDVGGASTRAASPVIRFTAPRDVDATMLACFTGNGRKGATLSIIANGPQGPVGRATLAQSAMIRADLRLRKGDPVDLRIDPATGRSGHTFRHRVTFHRPGTAPARCPAVLAGWN